MSDSALQEANPPTVVDVADFVQSFYDTANDGQSPVAHLQEQLISIRSALLSSPSSLSAFLSHHYGPFSLYLLSRFSVEWLSKLDPASRERCFALFFSSHLPRLACVPRHRSGTPLPTCYVLFLR